MTLSILWEIYDIWNTSPLEKVFFSTQTIVLPPIAMTIPTHSMMQMTPSMICSGNILGPRMLLQILGVNEDFFYLEYFDL